MDDKRRISILIPLKQEADKIFIYLQKRSKDMERLPNFFGFWGGGLESEESAEQALVREIKEELGIDIDMDKVRSFNRYEFLRSIKNIYLFEPGKDWDDSLTIGEGDYGRWFSTEEALARPDIILEDKTVINDLERILLKKPTK
ncbi:MAG: NUDIX domain-containing protein [Patescibacteria group bacterium]